MASRSKQLSPLRLRRLWQALMRELSRRGPVGDLPTGTTRPVPRAPAWSAFSNEEIFRAFAIALISGNSRWDRIQSVLSELHVPFQSFDLASFASLADGDLERSILPWFRQHKVGSISLRAGLNGLRDTAAKLSAENAPNSASRYLAAAAACADSPEDLAVMLATVKPWKLPGFGVALAAEALRNLGVDIAKPDRHILRALGSWSLIEFRRWERHGDFTPPHATTDELRRAMLTVRAIADANGLSVSAANSVIWTASAISGYRLTNSEFGQLIS